MRAERPLEVAAQQLVGAVQAHRHVGAGDVELARYLGDGALVEVPEPHDVGVRRRQMIYRLQQDAHQLAPVERLVGTRRGGAGAVVSVSAQRWMMVTSGCEARRTGGLVDGYVGGGRRTAAASPRRHRGRRSGSATACPNRAAREGPRCAQVRSPLPRRSSRRIRTIHGILSWSRGLECAFASPSTNSTSRATRVTACIRTVDTTAERPRLPVPQEGTDQIPLDRADMTKQVGVEREVRCGGNP